MMYNKNVNGVNKSHLRIWARGNPFVNVCQITLFSTSKSSFCSSSTSISMHSSESLNFKKATFKIYLIIINFFLPVPLAHTIDHESFLNYFNFFFLNSPPQVYFNDCICQPKLILRTSLFIAQKIAQLIMIHTEQ